MTPTAPQSWDAAARLAAERYVLLVTNLPSTAVMMFDHDLRFVLADGPELARHGHSKAGLEGKLLYDAVDPAFAALVEPNLRAALGGRQFRAELPFGDLYYAYTYEPLRDADGEVLYALVVAQDITPLRQAEQSARQNEERIREIVGNVPGVVFAIGADRRFRFSEGLSLSRAGYAPGQLVGQLVDDVYGDQPELLRYLDRALAGERVIADVPVGDLLWETRYTPLSSDGVVTEVIGVAWDVTDRRREEASTRQSQKLEAVGRLAGGVAHDFNNMLAVMTSAAEELSLGLQGNSGLRELSDMIVGAAGRAAQLTRQLLAFARSKPISSGPVIVDDVVVESVTLLRRSVDCRMGIHTRLAAPGAVAVVDAAQLQTALINLGLNARDAMPDGGDLTIATDVIELQGASADTSAAAIAPGSYVRISVSDTGVGIEPENIGRVFDPFFTTKDVGQGTGLGLAVVYGTARAHGGTVTVESEPGRGTTFRMLLPRSTALVGGGRAPETAPAIGKGLILLVEDEPLVRRVGQRLLGSLGYEVVAASDGAEGIEVFRERHEELAMVFCDVIMPGMTGLEAVRRMHEIDPDVPIALCSGYTREHLATVDRDVVMDVVAKPYRRDEIAALLERVARVPRRP